jgi:hypothetical protein
VLESRLRESVRDHLYSLQRHSSHRCVYLNLAVRRVPSWLRRVPFDLVVFHTTFLSKRANPAYFQRLCERAEPLKSIGARRVVLPQDEYLPPSPLCDFIEDFGVDHVFSVAPPSEWPAIYPGVDAERVGISRVLTGYLEPGQGEQPCTSSATRPTDIGYRAKEIAPWLGRQGQLKAEVGRAFAAAAPAVGLRTDISMQQEDTLLGPDWMRFLASCKYTLGVEGGASLLDRDGSIRACTERFLAEHPGSSFEEIEAACFPGQDGSFGLVALSPRHLEACATRTCQILIEGEYNGVLEANRHYLPLRADLSNVDEVLETVRRDDRRAAIVDAAYADVVASGAYSYRRFVEEIERVALPAAVSAPGPLVGAANVLSRGLDWLSWRLVEIRARAARAAGPLLRRLRAG